MKTEISLKKKAKLEFAFADSGEVVIMDGKSMVVCSKGVFDFFFEMKEVKDSPLITPASPKILTPVGMKVKG